VRINFTGTISV